MQLDFIFITNFYYWYH